MPWKEVNSDELAVKLGIHPSEVREKHRLIGLIRETRKSMGLSQTVLAKRLGVTQGRIAQIESGIGTNKITFDILLNILTLLGYDFRIVSKKVA